MSNNEKLYCVYKHTSPSGKIYIGMTCQEPPEKRWHNGNGYKNNPHFIKKIEDSNGNTLYEYKEKSEQVLNSSLVYITNEILTSTYNYSFIDYICFIVLIISSAVYNYRPRTNTHDYKRNMVCF